MGKEYIAGISTAGDCGHLAVFELKKTDRRLVHLEVFAREGGDRAWFLRPLLEPATRLLRKVSKVSVALGDDAVIVHAFPIDSSLTQPEQNEHVHWELANVVPEYRARDHVFDVHVLRSRARDQVADILVVAVARSLIFEMQKAAAGKGIELETVDTNYFASERALLHNYPELKSRGSLLIAAGEGGMEFGLVQNGRTIRYERTPMLTAAEIAGRIGVHPADEAPAGVYACGTGASASFIAELQGLLPLPAAPLNPFRRLADGAHSDALEHFAGSECQLAACAGIAFQRA